MFVTAVVVVVVCGTICGFVDLVGHFVTFDDYALFLSLPGGNMFFSPLYALCGFLRLHLCDFVLHVWFVASHSFDDACTRLNPTSIGVQYCALCFLCCMRK